MRFVNRAHIQLRAGDVSKRRHLAGIKCGPGSSAGRLQETTEPAGKPEVTSGHAWGFSASGRKSCSSGESGESHSYENTSCEADERAGRRTGEGTGCGAGGKASRDAGEGTGCGAGERAGWDAGEGTGGRAGWDTGARAGREAGEEALRGNRTSGLVVLGPDSSLRHRAKLVGDEGRDKLRVLLQVGCVGLVFACNAVMWTFFAKALRYSSSSATATVTTTASNFLSSAFLGKLLFGETHTLLWWAGITMTLCGLLLLHTAPSQSEQIQSEKKDK